MGSSLLHGSVAIGAMDEVEERAALEVLSHHREGTALGDTHANERDDVRVLKLSQERDFLAEGLP